MGEIGRARDRSILTSVGLAKSLLSTVAGILNAGAEEFEMIRKLKSGEYRLYSRKKALAVVDDGTWEHFAAGERPKPTNARCSSLSAVARSTNLPIDRREFRFRRSIGSRIGGAVVHFVFGIVQYRLTASHGGRKRAAEFQLVAHRRKRCKNL